MKTDDIKKTIVVAGAVVQIFTVMPKKTLLAEESANTNSIKVESANLKTTNPAMIASVKTKQSFVDEIDKISDEKGFTNEVKMSLQQLVIDIYDGYDHTNFNNIYLLSKEEFIDSFVVTLRDNVDFISVVNSNDMLEDAKTLLSRGVTGLAFKDQKKIIINRKYLCSDLLMHEIRHVSNEQPYLDTEFLDNEFIRYLFTEGDSTCMSYLVDDHGYNPIDGGKDGHFFLDTLRNTKMDYCILANLNFLISDIVGIEQLNEIKKTQNMDDIKIPFDNKYGAGAYKEIFSKIYAISIINSEPSVNRFYLYRKEHLILLENQKNTPLQISRLNQNIAIYEGLITEA